MSNKDLDRSLLENPHHHESDDEDGTDISTLEDSEYSCNNDRTTTYPHVAQPNRGRSPGASFEFNAGNNRNMQGTQRAGNITAPSLPQRGRFVFNTGNNFNNGKLQDAGNITIGVNKPKKMKDPSKISHRNKRSLTDAASPFRNLKHHRRDDTSDSNHSPTTLLPAAREPNGEEPSGPGIRQDIRNNTNKNGIQQIGNLGGTATTSLRGGISQEIDNNTNEGREQSIANVNFGDQGSQTS